MIESLSTWVVAVGLFIFMVLANEIGFRLGIRDFNKVSEISRSVSALLKGSIFGLVAFLLAFAFSNTSSRYDSRRQVVLDEANSIGTCYLRAKLLQKDLGKEMKTILRDYTKQRVDLFQQANPQLRRTILSEMDGLMNKLWFQVEQAFERDAATAHYAMIVPAANAVIDMHGTRSWASKGHLQPVVLTVLVACVLISSILIGHSSGQTTQRHAGLWISFNLLFAIVLFVILDFENPQQGFVEIDHSPLTDLLQTMVDYCCHIV